MTPLTSTLADLTKDKLVAYAQQNMPAAPATGSLPATSDPTFMETLDRIQFVGEIYGGGIDGKLNGLNAGKLGQFSNVCNEWEKHGKESDLTPYGITWSMTNGVPDFPIFDTFDESAFEQWFALRSSCDDRSSPNYGNNTLIAWLAQNEFYRKPAPALPAVVVLAPNTKPKSPTTDGPIGAPVPFNPGVFNPSPSDSYPDGYVYAGPTGIYQKHVFSNPFTASLTRSIWIQLQATPSTNQ